MCDPTAQANAGRGLELTAEQQRDPTALAGELGAIPSRHGGYHTELSLTFPDGEGRWFNAPSLVAGQQDVGALTRGEPLTDQQADIARARALEREAAGAALPRHDTRLGAIIEAMLRSSGKQMFVEHPAQQLY